MIFLTLSCGSFNNNKNTSMKTDMQIENADIQLIYTRDERSKDSNGTEIIISLKDNTLYYHKRNWGFKAIKKVTNKKIKIDDKFLNFVNDFITNKLPTKDYSKDIKTKKRFAFTTFKYVLSVNNVEKKYKVEISTNDRETDNEYYNNLDELFSDLEDRFDL